MFYWVQKFCALGLLRVTSEEPRRGKAIEYYRASAESYLIPLRIVPVETLEALARLRDGPWVESSVVAPLLVWGYALSTALLSPLL